MSETTEKCRCCLSESDVNELRSIFKLGKICGQITRLAEMLKFLTNLEVMFCRYQLFYFLCLYVDGE